MADEMTLRPMCRNCGNTGYDMFHRRCMCKMGRALEQMTEAGLGNAPFVEPVSYGAVSAAPVTDETRQTTKQCACEECDTVTWCSWEPLYVGSYVVSHIWLCNACVVKRAQKRKQRDAQANEPRAIIRAFAQAMERKLAANDGVKGDWRSIPWPVLLTHLNSEVGELRDALTAAFVNAANMTPDGESLIFVPDDVQAVLMEAADVALYALMLADRVGALPPTDERGR